MMASNTSEGDGCVAGQETRTVGLVYSASHMQTCNTMPRIEGRCKLVHGLIHACGLPKSLVLIKPEKASMEELCEFHCRQYLESLRAGRDDGEDEDDDAAEMYGLGYDCPLFDGVYDYVGAVAGGTLAAVAALCSGACRVACHWEGGWHHGHRDQASGFCYVNDIVLAILRLRDAGLRRVLYVDLDVHHGDGVEGAFGRSGDVMTVSFHRHAPGFFPGTGGAAECGAGRGLHRCLNVPLGDGTRDATFVRVAARVLDEALRRFAPDAVVCQCGADGLAGDPLGAFNLTPSALCACVERLAAWGRPLLVLGGGGYHFANAARCWTRVTARLVGRSCGDGGGGDDGDADVPEHENFAAFGPDFTLAVTPGNRREELAERDVDRLLAAALAQLANVEPPAEEARTAQVMRDKDEAAVAAATAVAAERCAAGSVERAGESKSTPVACLSLAV